MASARLKELWQTPEFRERMRERNEKVAADRKANPEKYKRTGVPDGMRRAKAQRLWARAYALADRFIQIMIDKGELPPTTDETVDVDVLNEDGDVVGTKQVIVPSTNDGKAKAALREAFVLAVGPSTQQIKIQALNTVLNFTMSKPESKVKLTTKPEAFLDELDD